MGSWKTIPTLIFVFVTVFKGNQSNAPRESLKETSQWLGRWFTRAWILFVIMKLRRVGSSLMAALMVGILVTPNAKPSACELTGLGVMLTQHVDGAERTSSQGGDDAGLCHNSVDCLLVSAALLPAAGRDALMPMVSRQHEVSRPEFVSANLQPPLTPPPRA